MLRPYPSATLADSPRQSVPGVLRDQRIGVDLRLRNRHQDERRGPRTSPRRRVLELPAGGERAVPDQILAPLPLTVELEQALPQDDVRSNGAERVPAGVRARTYLPQQRQGSRAARPPGELRFGLDEIDFGQTEPGEIVAVVLLHMLRVGGPLVDARALAFARGRYVGDANREDQRVALPVRRGLAVLDVHLRPHEEHLPALIEGIERVVRLCHGGEAVPRRGAE